MIMKNFTQIRTFSVTILGLLLIATLSGCANSQKKTDTVSNTTDSTSVIERKSQDTSETYATLPALNLPLVFSMYLLEDFMAYEPPSAAWLPQKDDLKFIITCTEEPNGERMLELQSLSDDLKPLDKLQLYSIEEVDGGNNVIAQTFEIDADYRIKVSKHLNETLIEQLTYTPTAKGIFEELRNGKTTTVAFDSYDHINYIVQTFVWDRDTNGGLIKKNLQTVNYELTGNGLVKK